jgi:ABC-2 type transport system ATP-binding protein
MRDVLATAGIAVDQADDGALEARSADAARIGELAAASQVAVHEMSVQRASLEQAFMRLTRNAADYRPGGPPR